MESHISIDALGWLYMTPDENALAYEENFARDMYTDLLPDYILGIINQKVKVN